MAVFPPIETPLQPTRQKLTAAAMRINNMLRGKLNCAGHVTLTANSATTALKDANIGFGSVILFSPKTANAAAEASAMHYTISARGEASITHNNLATTDRSFGYVVIA